MTQKYCSLLGTEEEQISYCFTIYDLNGDGYISRLQFYALTQQTEQKCAVLYDTVCKLFILLNINLITPT